MSSSLNSFIFKRGDTLTFTVRWRPRKSGIQNLIGATVTSMAKDFKDSYWSFDTVVAEDGMSFTCTCVPSTTKAFATGNAKWDARVSIGDVVIHTPTVNFVVVDDITKPPSPIVL